MKMKARLVAKRSSTAGGTLPNAYIGGDARPAGKSMEPQPLSAADVSFGRQARGIALAWPGRKDSSPMLKKASAYRMGVGRSVMKGSSLGGADRNRALRQKSADRSAVLMLQSECAWCCRVKRGLVGPRPKRPKQVVAKKPHLPAMLPAVVGVSFPVARTPSMSCSMRRTRTGLGRNTTPCWQSSRMTPCTA